MRVILFTKSLEWGILRIMIAKARFFLREAWSEMRKVNWPTRQETINLTLVVIIMSLCLAALLGILDIIFTNLIERVIL